MRPYLLASLLFLTACGRYQSFTLGPAPAHSSAGNGTAGPKADGQILWQWEEAGPVQGPVLGRGTEGAFDDVDALNPTTVFWQRPGSSGTYLNLYSGFDGKTWHTGLAESADLVTWKKFGRVLSPSPNTWEGDYIAANGAVTQAPDGTQLLYWYQAGSPPQIGLATSSDGRTWQKMPEPVLPKGPRGSWDEMGVGDPYVIRHRGLYYLYFLGQDRARRQRLGVARSADGRTWTKALQNPILELGELGMFDAKGLGEPAVFGAFGKWWMLYTGRDQQENRRMGLAESLDGVTWQRVRAEAFLAGGQPWNSRVVCDADIVPQNDGSWLVLYGGGDRPQPAENLNGQIGLGRLRAIVQGAPAPVGSAGR